MTKPYQRPSADEPAWWFICAGGEIVLDDDHQPPHGRAEELPLPTLDEYQIIWLGEVRERSCYLVLADYGDDAFAALGEFQSLRPLIEKHDEEMFSMASRAKQITEFVSTHRFCGRCGARMQAVDWELAMQCHTCKHRCYPRISPCIIVAIRNGKKILLARGERHRPGLYSVLAGFVESGETLEQTLAREVMEEAGIKVKNVQYVCSQPWPFPNSLMMGFTAEWESGDLHFDPFELEDGAWYGFDELPDIPLPGTIANRLIETVKAQIEQESDS
ncbi:NAD(+) diphosphatase [Pseudidiomarina sp. 1APP75-32.1]|uniref:NAD-capped RNA hydrolase NudC n=1 Tax=Pseudidiomarina terrestris TaxID=2820060 RepID=A0AAW7R239_9GAMM|nr:MULTISPECIES: NAD(+) diphosphatase [unclassified Pseudidiomarina]MDN7125027.1 NAD(+) diphosphatase [Pseudidiomarina sp. 1APP75-32.1]MDN7129498.1 NAD(+) diphosphatase [Pseudidiomarina sp. 1APR75-15]MEA3587974.1 NAD(+) diphosphatase [Pseudidiomarina sp. 1APP75-27a]